MLRLILILLCFFGYNATDLFIKGFDNNENNQQKTLNITISIDNLILLEELNRYAIGPKIGISKQHKITEKTMIGYGAYSSLQYDPYINEIFIKLGMNGMYDIHAEYLDLNFNVLIPLIMRVQGNYLKSINIGIGNTLGISFDIPNNINPIKGYINLGYECSTKLHEIHYKNDMCELIFDLGLKFKI